MAGPAVAAELAHQRDDVAAEIRDLVGVGGEAAVDPGDRLGRCLKLGGFVSCTPEFTDHPEVVNGASDLIVLAMGEAGHHARFAVGCPSLPRNAAVEVEAIFELA